MRGSPPSIAVLGASGLIGEAVATALMRDGFSVLSIARRFNSTQKAALGASAIECPTFALDPSVLSGILEENHADIVVNCIGVL